MADHKNSARPQKVDHGGNFVQLPRAILSSPAFLSLSLRARSSLYVVLERFNGFNNGRIRGETKANACDARIMPRGSYAAVTNAGYFGMEAAVTTAAIASVRKGVESGHVVLHGSGSRSGAITLKRNFQFNGFSVVRWGNRFIDLHNAYDLESFGTDLAGSEVKLGFTRNEHAIEPDKLPSKVTLSCTGNVRVAFNNLGEISTPLDDEGIEIAYFDEGCDWLSFLDEDIARSQEPMGLHVSFINGLAIRIFCDEATLTTQ